MDLKLAGRRALVTGGSRGIGRSIVEAFAREGAEVVFCGRGAQTGEAAARTLQADGLPVAFVQADTDDTAALEGLAARALAGGPIDILVNNVGGVDNPDGAARGWLEIPAEEWEATFRKNVTGAVRLCRLFAPAMRERGWGRVINISSAAGLEPGNAVPADYSATKAAMNTMTISLSRALARTGVTVNAISPGPVLTDGFQGWIDAVKAEREWPETGEALEKRFVREMFDLCTERLGRPEDVAVAACYLASPLAAYVTGANLRVDGGLSRAAV